MAKAEIKHPEKRVSTGAYSAAVLIDGWLYVSGQGPLDMTTGAIVPGSIEEQTRLTLRHIGKILEAAGCNFSDVVKCTCHLSDIGDFERLTAPTRSSSRGFVRREPQFSPALAKERGWRLTRLLASQSRSPSDGEKVSNTSRWALV